LAQRPHVGHMPFSNICATWLMARGTAKPVTTQPPQSELHTASFRLTRSSSRTEILPNLRAEQTSRLQRGANGADERLRCNDYRSRARLEAPSLMGHGRDGVTTAKRRFGLCLAAAGTTQSRPCWTVRIGQPSSRRSGHHPSCRATIVVTPRLSFVAAASKPGFGRRERTASPYDAWSHRREQAEPQECCPAADYSNGPRGRSITRAHRRISLRSSRG